MNIVNLLQLTGEEKVTAMIHVREMEQEDAYIFFATKNGTVKRVALSVLNTARKAGVRAITLEEGDELVNACLTTGTDTVILATRNGSAIRFDEGEVRVMGREASGVRGIRLRDDDVVIGAALERADGLLLTVTENGYGKRTDPAEYTRHHRGGGGITAHNLTEKTGALVGIKCILEEDDILLINSSGVVIRTDSQSIRQCKRVSQGVILIRLDEGDRVISLACTPKEEDEEEAADETTAQAVENSNEEVAPDTEP